MSEARDYLLAIDNDKAAAAQIAEETAQRLQTKTITLIGVVQSLGEWINDEDPKVRGKSVSYLTAVLAALPPKYLSRQQIQVLCHFFCDRIQDGGAIEGLISLSGLQRLNNEMVQITGRAVLEQFQDLQTRPQTARFQILQLLNDLLSNHRKAVRDMGGEFLVGFLDLVGGEKDPRNLMLVFSMLKVLMVEWDIDQHSESLFDAVFAYFPITFRPPPNDPYGITAQDLKERLQECISSTGLLAPYAIPAMLDKLDSTSPNVKKDSLRAITACAASYLPDTLRQYSITLWDSLKFEILNAQEEDLAAEALQALKTIAETLSKDPTPPSPQTPLAQYTKPLTKECNEHLEEPLQRQAKSAGQILGSISSASSGAFTLITKGVLPKLLTIYQSADSISKQRALSEVAIDLFDSALSIFGTWKTPAPKTPDANPLDEFKDKILELFSRALMGTVVQEVSFRSIALRGLLKLAQLRDFLLDNEIGLIVQYMDDIVLTEEPYGRDELKGEAIQGLAEISRNKPNLIMEITYPAFMSRLPDKDTSSPSQYITLLEGLAEISVEKEIFETLIRRLLNKLDMLLKAEHGSSVQYPEALLSTILFVMTRKGLTSDPNVGNYFDKIVVGLVRRAALSTQLDGNDKLTALNDGAVLDVLGRICALITRASSTEGQVEVSKNIYNLFSFPDGYDDMFGGRATAARRELLILSTWLLAGLPRKVTSVPSTIPHISKILTDLTSLAVVEESPATRLAILRQIALYVNKFLSSTDVSIGTDTLEMLFQSLKTKSDSTNGIEIKQEDRIHNTIRSIFWLSKALILRFVPTTNDILSNLLSLLSTDFRPEVGSAAANGFGMLLTQDDVFSTSNGAQIRLLAKQRVFTIVTPLIAQNFKSTTDSGYKNNLLTSLSGVLSTVPSSIVMPELPTLLPLLLQSLDLVDPAVKAATLETLIVVIRENPIALEESGHVPSLVRRLLKAALFDKGKSIPRTRALAIKCLGLFPGSIGKATTAANPLLSLKKEVLRSLSASLDDPKREVRKEAVATRGLWLRGVDEVVDDSD